MENNEQKFVTNEELVNVVHDVLLPAIQSMFDETNKRIDGLEDETHSLKNETHSLKDETYSLKKELVIFKQDTADNFDEVKNQITSLTKRVENIDNKVGGAIKTEREDIDAFGKNYFRLDKVVKNHELRLQTLEG